MLTWEERHNQTEQIRDLDGARHTDFVRPYNLKVFLRAVTQIFLEDGQLALTSDQRRDTRPLRHFTVSF